MADGSQASLRSVRTTCPYCGVGCGVTAVPDGLGGATVTGDTEHPANFGRLCSKGSALGETLSPATRLLYPEIAGTRVDWDRATRHVASELQRVRQNYGPKAIAFYLSGQLLTEDYYVANKLAKGFIGTPHVDTNSRLCMASSVAGHKRAFGADVVPGCYDDLDTADLVVLVGSNTAWCHPVLYQRIQKARQTRGTKVVNIDPRRTATSEGADLQLSLAAGSDTCLWNGLLVWLAGQNLIDAGYISAHTEDFEPALALARERAGTISKVAFHTGLPAEDVQAFFELWGANPRVVSCYSQGVNQSIQGTDKVNAIINCHLATGRIAKPGMGPLSLTGQPNAMGGREVGGLANMLAAHMEFSPRERELVERFWKAPHLAEHEGLKAVALFDAIDRGEIKALWVIGSNPAVSMPRANATRAALSKLELLVVSEVVHANDTSAAATVKLPAHGWGEKDGTVTNSERCISRQRPFLTPAGDARPDWWILSRVAGHLGWGDAFNYRSAAGIFVEHAALSGFENTGERVFNIAGLADLSESAYDNLEPVQWPVLEPGRSTQRVFSDGQFATPSRRARFIAVARTLERNATSDAYPLLLNTGRIRDQWHTMTRTGLTARLSAHISEPFAEIHPTDAAAAGIEDGGLVRLETAHGAAVVKAVVTDRGLAGAVFAPIHWSAQNSSAGRIGALVHSAADPVSGQPDLKATPARASAVEAALSGFILSALELPILSHPDVVYWARSKNQTGTLTTFAIDGTFAVARSIIEACLPHGARLTMSDARVAGFRSAVLCDGRLEAIAFLGSPPNLQPGAWLKSMLMRDQLAPFERLALLAGELPNGAEDAGPIVCVCHQVGSRRIGEAIAAGCQSTEAVGLACSAGTNCGSCVPEINRMLSGYAVRAGAAKKQAVKI